MYSKSDQKTAPRNVHQRGMLSYEKRQLSFRDEFDNIVEYLKKKICLLTQHQSQSTIDGLMDYVFDITSPLLKHIEFPMQIPYQTTFCGKRILQTIEFWTLYQIIFYLLNPQKNQYFNRLEELFQIRLNKCLTKDQIIDTHKNIYQIEQVQQFTLNFQKLCEIQNETIQSLNNNQEQYQNLKNFKIPCKKIKIIINTNNNQNIKKEEFSNHNQTESILENINIDRTNYNSTFNESSAIKDQTQLQVSTILMNQFIKDEQKKAIFKKELQELVIESINDTINNNNQYIETEISRTQNPGNETSQFISLETLYLSSNVEFVVLIHNVNRNNSNSLIQVLEGEYEGQFALYQFKEAQDEKVKKEDFDYYQNYLEYRKVRQNQPLVVIHKMQVNNDR
ncbi:unnamed protein product (macronuclear) [Paramecium tetraurelia]|uniref:Uncharacterized protein n=1 Tax=Paramecium tetraurelia TaxID=5888 RepID=A0CSS7_PARTE|nr:uncharacterized protein GSPATT00010116001 [Paramecium tetraurelia]CAK73844.1 unnamed protein product [Paramecium tetraurelia]|eukprot:XP_001441241.1 hypothetical protein (macronuclear) [Paramecium tetraurelia strain d4-2]